jgi:1-acyl-sn-glycerol-3-phosphate acyltransferase
MVTKTVNLIRTGVFSVFVFISILIYGSFLPLAFCSKKIAKSVSVVWVNVIFILTKYTLNIKIKIQNPEIAKRRGVIIVSNHCSAWETFFIAHHFDIPTFVLKKSLFNIPLLGPFLKALNMIGIDRESYSKKYRQEIVKRAHTELINGHNMAIFPQGTRVPIEETYNYEKYPYKSGVTIFAGGHYVLTMSTDARKCFGKSLFSLKKTGSINVIFNECIKIDDSLSKHEIMDIIQKSIEGGCRKIIN